jgi:predicted  nucleic acid-binding Zn-ribbon protein
MENLLGVAKSYLEENGIDTSMMLEDEIIDKYHSMLTEELSELEEEISDVEEEISDVEDAIIDEEAEPEIESEEQSESEEVQETEEVDNSEDSLTQFLNDNAELIETFNEEQKSFLEQLISIKK